MHVYRCYFLSQHRTHLALEVIRCGGDVSGGRLLV